MPRRQDRDRDRDDDVSASRGYVKPSADVSAAIAPYTNVIYAAFVVVAAVLVYGFVTVAKEGELRRRCSATCLMHPQYSAVDRKVPSFTLNDLSGKKVSIEDYRGKVVLLNFWTRTCGPCMDEMPELAELTHVLQSRPDVAVVTISTDESAQVIKDVLKGVIREDKPPFQVLIDPDGNEVVDKKFGTHLFPETWIIDARGVIRARFDGSRNWSSAEVVEMIDEVRSGGYCPLNIKSGESEMTGEGAHVCAALTGQGQGAGSESGAGTGG